MAIEALGSNRNNLLSSGLTFQRHFIPWDLVVPGEAQMIHAFDISYDGIQALPRRPYDHLSGLFSKTLSAYAPYTFSSMLSGIRTFSRIKVTVNTRVILLI